MTKFYTPTLNIPSGPWSSNDNVVALASKQAITRYKYDSERNGFVNFNGDLTYIHVNNDCIAQTIEGKIHEPYYDKAITNSGWIGFQFALSGEQFSIVDGYGQMSSSGPRFSVCATSHSTRIVKYHQPSSIGYVNILVRPEYLIEKFGVEANLFPEQIQSILNGKDNGYYACTQTLTSAMSNAARILINCNYKDKLFETFAKVKVMELLCLAIDAITQEEHVEFCTLKLSDRDIMLLHQVRDEVQNNFVNPPQLSEISRNIGLNRNKLSFGFKGLFGCGVYEYCQQYRMLQAKKLLQETSLSILEIAIEVGFQNHSSFSRAYKGFYGRAPSQDRDS